MTLEEAIKHCEEVAETQEENCKYAGHDHYTKLEASACAAEHRQLAEWLKELKELRERSASETNDGDMLSRQSLIDSFKYDDNGELWSIDDVIYRLKQFPSVREEPLDAGDTIYRQAAIDALKEKRDSAKEWYEESSASGDEMMSARAESAIMTFVECLLTIKKLPSAHPEQKWIPCTPKTMPPYWVLVWVTDNHGHVAVCQLSHKENHYWYDGDERWMYEHDSIIAWMPYNVPEPYQAERREDVSNQ